MRISVSAAALALGGSLALGALIAPAAHAVPGEQCQSLGVANLYGEFVEGDDTHTPDAEGAVAVGGNADFASFSVGQELTAEQIAKLPGGNALVVGGTLTGNVQLMKGNGVYGKLVGNVDPHAGKAVQGASPIDFAAEFTKLRAASAELAKTQTAGVQIKLTGNRLTLTGTDAALNSFVLPAAQLEKAKEVFLDVPVGSVTVINVTGDAYDQAKAGTSGFFIHDAATKKDVLDDKTQSAAGGAIRAKLLWNFPTATKVVKNSGNAWPGSVLAPNAHFELGSGGPVNGSVIAKSLVGSGGAETHHYPFTGCLPTPVPPATTPPGTATTTTGGGTTTTGGGTSTPSPTPKPSGSVPASTPPNGSQSPTPSAPATHGSSTTGGGLAFTGANGIIPLAIGGVLVLAVGGGIVFVARRKRA